MGSRLARVTLHFRGLMMISSNLRENAKNSFDLARLLSKISEGMGCKNWPVLRYKQHRIHVLKRSDKATQKWYLMN